MKKKKSLNKDDVVLTKKRPDWLNSKEIDKTLFDNDIFQIFLFYVFYSPCSKFATQGRTLQYYNWNDKPWKTNRYLKDKLNGDQFTEKGKYFRSVERMTDLHEALRKAELDGKFYSKKNIERVAFFNCENSEYMSLFHHIRCALAHGRAALFEDKENNDTILIMENGIEKGNDFQVKARMVLRKSTLLRWEKIITDGPQEAEKNYRYEIFQELLKNPSLHKKDLEKIFNEPKSVIDKAINFLNDNHVVKYQNHGKNGWWDTYPEIADHIFKQTERVE